MELINKIRKRFFYKIPEEFIELYQSYHDKLFASRLNVGYLFCIILIPIAFLFDIIIFPDQWHQLFRIRIFSMLVCIILFILSNKTFLKKYPSNMTYILIIVASATISYLNYLTGALASPYYVGLILVFIAIAMVSPLGIKGSLLSSLFIFIIHFSFNLFPQLKAHESINWSLFWNSIYFLSFCFIMVVISSGMLENYRRQIFVRTEEEKIRSEKLVQSKKKIDELMKTKSRFLSNITHELKTPLSIVIGSSDIILEDSARLSNSMKDHLQVIQKAALQLSAHVDRIVKISTTGDPEAELTLNNYNYVRVVEYTYAMFESRAKKEKKKYTIKIPSKPLIANIDILRIQEVLTNLIQNAFKFTSPGDSITISVGTDGENIYTEVLDTGIGIPEDKLDKIFERLYQVDESMSKKYEGLGLGLYICKQNVELHGGEISARSKLGKGTSFKYTLPIYINQDVPVLDARVSDIERRVARRRKSSKDRRHKDRRVIEQEKMLEYQSQFGIEDLADMTYLENIRDYENQNPASPSILVVEDNLGMMKVIIESLKDDYNLFLAQDGFDALEKLKICHDRIYLILSDIMMPGISGFDFCKKVMENSDWHHIPIIFVTALLKDEDQIRGFELGATDYIVKPYNVKILKEKIDHWISRRQYEVILHDVSNSLETKLYDISRIHDIMIHEIRNPLQLISGAGFFLQQFRDSLYEDSTEQEKKWRRAIKMLNQGLKSIKSVLETSKSLESEGYLKKRPELVTDLLDDTVEQCTMLLKNTKLQIDLESAAYKKVLCDKRILTQVFVNLIKNAIEAIKEKKPREKGLIRITSEINEDDFVVIKIQDNGVGISPEIQEEMFKFKFTTKKDGTGVGLHLSKMVLKMHYGDISVESEEGKGSTFFIYLPVLDE